jgi:hypothetical protein
MQSDDNILNSGLGQSAVRQIAFSLRELMTHAETGTIATVGIRRKGRLSVFHSIHFAPFRDDFPTA